MKGETGCSPPIAEVDHHCCSDAIAKELTARGHLSIGAAGLPAIDSRGVGFGNVAELAIRGPLILVARSAHPPPLRSRSDAPLFAVAEAYAGAEVHNIRFILNLCCNRTLSDKISH
jgi:hypothetical protein